MGKKKNRGLAAPSSEPAPDLLAELRRLYSDTGMVTDQFGRRQAIPSEVERILRSSRRNNQGQGE